MTPLCKVKRTWERRVDESLAFKDVINYDISFLSRLIYITDFV